MEARKKKLPIGIENFEEIRTKGFYYVDKTGLMKELLENWAAGKKPLRDWQFQKRFHCVRNIWENFQ